MERRTQSACQTQEMRGCLLLVSTYSDCSSVLHMILPLSWFSQRPDHHFDRPPPPHITRSSTPPLYSGRGYRDSYELPHPGVPGIYRSTMYFMILFQLDAIVVTEVVIDVCPGVA
jgi:hypothetical protein